MNKRDRWNSRADIKNRRVKKEIKEIVIEIRDLERKERENK